MYKRIVVALDGSDLGERALPYVAPLAQKFGATITLLRATSSLEQLAAAQASAAGAMPAPVFDAAQMAADEQKDAAAYLEKVSRRIAGEGSEVRRQVPQGSPAECIVECANDLEADLIAMTTHGRGGLKRLALGSVADEVVRHAPCPVLLVRIAEESQT